MMVESHMSFVQSLLTSRTGLTVVFSVLVILALATIIIAKIVGKLTGTQGTPAPQTVPAAWASLLSKKSLTAPSLMMRMNYSLPIQLVV